VKIRKPSATTQTAMTSLGRPFVWAAAGLLIVCAGCSSATPSASAPTSGASSSASSASSTTSAGGGQADALRLADAPALLVQCLLDRGTMKPSDAAFAGQSTWLHGANIILNSTSASQFTAWFGGHDGSTVAGQTLVYWTQWAAAHDQLPAPVCGSNVSAATLQKRVFAQDPAAGQPWSM